MDIFIKSTKSEWEGMAYIAIYGDMGKLEGVGIGQFASNFKDAYVILRNKQSNKECGGIIKTIQPIKRILLKLIRVF